MKVIGILLILLSFLCVAAGSVAFGDIGLSILFAGVVSALSGTGLLFGSRRLKKLEKMGGK